MPEEYATGDEAAFRRAYRQHDTAEDALVDTFRGLGCAVERTGFDPHQNGDRQARKRAQATKDPDLSIESLPVEVKTTSRREYLGNVAERKWSKYPPRTWFACFYIEDGDLLETGAYRKDRVTVDGRNESPHGDVFVEPRPVGPLFDLFRAVANTKVGDSDG
jgi:hypothetical protein